MILVATLAVAALAACHKADDTSNTGANAEIAPMAAADNGATVDTSNRANPPIAADQSRPAVAAAAGHNSFTEGQAVGHLTNAGYTNVTRMTQDDQGVWHGQATDKSGKAVLVSVDYQGSITTQ
jgi:putative membrane protein